MLFIPSIRFTLIVGSRRLQERYLAMKISGAGFVIVMVVAARISHDDHHVPRDISFVRNARLSPSATTVARIL